MDRAMDGEVRFLADGMLGTLAKWLRILGCDTAYDVRWDDNEVARRARAEGRVLLSRDHGLLRRRGLPGLLIESQVLDEQLAQVFLAFGLRAERSFSRCPVCNSQLEQVPRTDAWGQVPPFVYATHDQFSLCPECDRFYWRGTHWQRMRKKLEELTR
jgi:uncharacterized protein with PIN domain